MALVINAAVRARASKTKVQIDPSEETTDAPGAGRNVFDAGPLEFGSVICHEGWRYPETVRWAARRGAHLVFHGRSMKPNTCFFATVNYASEGSPITSAIIRPDGTLLCYQPYGDDSLRVGDVDSRRQRACSPRATNRSPQSGLAAA